MNKPVSDLLANLINQIHDAVDDSKKLKAAELCADAQQSCIEMIHSINSAASMLNHGYSKQKINEELIDVSARLTEVSMVLQGICITNGNLEYSKIKTLEEQVDALTATRQ